jgi:rhamnogalacturonyl hydrolase YesR
MKRERTVSTFLATVIASTCLLHGADAAKPTPAEVKALGTKVADWQLEHSDDYHKYIGRRRPHHPLAWHCATLYAGMWEFSTIKEVDKYVNWLKAIGQAHKWKLHPTKAKYLADGHPVGHLYLNLYRRFEDPAMLKPTQERFDWILANRRTGTLKWGVKGTDAHHRWGWCDALFMAPPVWARLANITGDRKYLTFMDEEYHATYDLLWDAEEHLFWRDSSYFSKREKNGEKLFWSRGNGWVLGGLALMIPDLPEDWEGREFYIDLFRNMSAKLKDIQRPDGTWSAGLLGSVEDYSTIETSGTAFITFGLAWGINAGILDRATYEPVVFKAWYALASAVQDDGLLGYVQPPAEAPGGSQKDLTEIYGIGAFLGAAAEVYKLVGGQVPEHQGAASAGLTDVSLHQILTLPSVVWNSPSKDSRGSMPIGNGDIGANVWVEPNGDLVFYLSKTDAWSENARLLKLGKVRVTCDPALLTEATTFKQELDLSDGSIRIQATTGDITRRITFRVDAHHPCVFVTVDANADTTLTATFEPWRTARREIKGMEDRSAYGLHGKGAPRIFVEPDTVVEGRSDSVLWYHRNERSIWADNLKLQALGEWTERLEDPLLHRTFGVLMRGAGLTHASPTRLVSDKPGRRFELRLSALTAQTPTADAWIQKIEALDRSIPAGADTAAAHAAWWKAFWERSWIVVSGDADAERVSRAYALQRWINACSGRGNSPIKFNGSIFTVDTRNHAVGRIKGLDADYRLWGGPYWWQNTRLPYWTMLAFRRHRPDAAALRYVPRLAPAAQGRDPHLLQPRRRVLPRDTVLLGNVHRCQLRTRSLEAGPRHDRQPLHPLLLAGRARVVADDAGHVCAHPGRGLCP